MKMILARFLLVSLCFIALVYAQSSSDVASMQALKASLTLPRDIDWSNADPCNWTGLKCDKSNRITRIQLSNKGISGTLPPHLKNLTSLSIFEVMTNNLTGAFPSLAGLKSLERVNIHDNGFTSFPGDFFTNLNSLQIVILDNNPFGSWEIPLSLKDATALVEFSAVNCNVTGIIPDFLGGLTFPSLTTLHLSSNLLHGRLPLSFVGSPVQELWLNGQKGAEKLNGSISILQNMTSLTEVWLQQNSFSGPIPDFSGLVSLVNFSGRDNQLTGVVPSSFTELQHLLTVSLSNNLLQGPIPIFKATNVQVELKGINSFCLDTPGTPCDPRVYTLLAIVEAFGYPVKFAENWKGNDPCDKWIGITCAGGNITIISFQNMGLTGTISPRFADLTSLQIINLSRNNLSGTIPEELTKLSNLKTLDVSSNQLYGKLPDFKPNVIDTSGNPNIGKDGPSSTPSHGKNGKNSGKTMGLIIGIVILLLFIGFVCFVLVKKKKQYHKMQYENGVLVHPQHSPDQDSLKITLDSLCDNGVNGNDGNIVISIQVLRDATDNFNEKNVLGRGGFGIVYKGELLDGTTVAVKRMESSIVSGKGLGEFKSEISVLTRVRHRNLVSLHGYCLEEDERLLVYQYMPQGTLSQHLFHWQEEGLKPLEWAKRLIIALDVGRGVEYLHTLAHQSFIHRDLKPSNILLGDDMRAKVADFGLVRLAPEGKQSIETRIAGTFGYLAPEYAVTGRVTTKVDVYSFGVILMELLTGRKALDARRSEEDAHLATWFRRMFINKDSFLKAIDETIKVNEDTLGSINKVAELASYCSAREPHQRPEMSYVVTVLVSLVEQWKPSNHSENSEDGYGMEHDDVPDPEVLRRWRELAGSSAIGESFSSSSMGDNHTQMSIPSRPSELDCTFKSEQGR